MSRFRPRISLLSALLRHETGRLSVDDPTKIHAIEVRTSEPLLWKWRVWVPQGHDVLVRSHWGSIPSTGVPTASASLHLKPGENWVTLLAHPNPNGNSWSARLEEGSGSSVGTSIPEPDRWWQWPTTSSTSTGVGFTTAVVNEDEPTFVLKSHRVSQTINLSGSMAIAVPDSGFIIWLERR
jgi:hypothetical protein